MNSQAVKKVAQNRANDYKLDPNFIVSSIKDLDKHAVKADIANAQMGIAPVFNNMFSELARCPRQAMVIKVDEYKTEIKRRFVDSTSSYLGPPASVDRNSIMGGERHKYFKAPLLTTQPNVIINKTIKFEVPKINLKTKRTCGIQTVYRDSSAQTSPWKPRRYVIMDGSDPEILKINFLKENLPPGMHEVEIIKYARKRRAWEKLMPEVEDAASLEIRRQILEAIEIEQWTLREKEINDIQELRLELLEKMLQELVDVTKNRSEQKMERISKRLIKENGEKIFKIKQRKERELRRLYRITYGISTKYEKKNIIDEHTDYKSEIYAPLMRHGEHPKRGHEKIKITEYKPLLFDIESLSTLPRWLFNSKIIDEEKLKLPGRRLCIRETKWTEPVLKQLHQELTTLRVTIRSSSKLRVKKIPPQVLDETARMITDELMEGETAEDEAALILQSIIRGRSAQTLIYEGRDRCRELIEELQVTHFLDYAQNTEMRKKRMEVLNQQRNLEIGMSRETNLEVALEKLRGHVMGTMFDFLSKELGRIMDERKAHALALMYERERRDKEAAEAGRRQLEQRRRQEHDEFFKQIVKVHQDTVDLYLRDIVEEGVDFVAGETAEKYVQKLAETIEETARIPIETYLDKEEIIANMICHFIVPEVKKDQVRKQVKQRQEKYLRCAHETIYNKIEKLCKITDVHDACLDKSSEEFQLPPLESSVSEVPASTAFEETITSLNSFETSDTLL